MNAMHDALYVVFRETLSKIYDTVVGDPDSPLTFADLAEIVHKEHTQLEAARRVIAAFVYVSSPGYCPTCGHATTVHGAGGCWHITPAPEKENRQFCDCMKPYSFVTSAPPMTPTQREVWTEWERIGVETK